MHVKMVRGLCAGMFFAIVLVGPVELRAQIGMPGGSWPGGGIGLPIPGRTRRQTQSQGSNNSDTRVSYSGTVDKINDTELVLDLSDGRMLTMSISERTKFYKESKEVDWSDLNAGDHVSVDATKDQQDYLHAMTVTFQQAGGDGDKQASSSPSSSGDDRPKLHRASPDSDSQTAASPQNSGTGPASSSGQSTPSGPAAQASQPAAPSQTAAAPATAIASSQSSPCENTPPVLKRGKTTPAPEPSCPDSAPAPAASAPASAPPPAQPAARASAAAPPAPAPPASPTRTSSPAQSLIEKATEETFLFSTKLPNFICEEFMSRFTQEGRSGQHPLDVVSAEIIYDGGQESYRNVKINDRPTDKSLNQIGGSWSTGEFATTLVDLFHPETAAEFRSGGISPIGGMNAQVYDFEVRRENSRWMVQAGSQALATAYGGSVWIDPKTARVLRIEMQARNLPSDFPMDAVESAVDYSWVMIGGTSVLLPVHAESLGCQRGTSFCSHNTIDFRNYREYKSDTKIIFGGQ